MSVLRVLGILVVAALLGYAIHRVRDPLHTGLPFGSTDLSSVQTALERLQLADRELVEAYVKRSNGDVLPEKFADPDQPFTARTFAQAIELEKTWAVERAEQEPLATSRQADRDAAMAPLRDAVEATVARAEVLSPRQLAAPPDSTASLERALPSDEATVFVVTVSLHNLGSKTIVGVKGALEASARDFDLPLQLCWFDLGAQQPIEPASRLEIHCGNPEQQVSTEQRAFVDDNAGRFRVTWNPTRVMFEDGTRLDSGL